MKLKFIARLSFRCCSQVYHFLSDQVNELCQICTWGSNSHWSNQAYLGLVVVDVSCCYWQGSNLWFILYGSSTLSSLLSYCCGEGAVITYCSGGDSSWGSSGSDRRDSQRVGDVIVLFSSAIVLLIPGSGVVIVNLFAIETPTEPTFLSLVVGTAWQHRSSVLISNRLSCARGLDCGALKLKVAFGARDCGLNLVFGVGVGCRVGKEWTLRGCLLRPNRSVSLITERSEVFLSGIKSSKTNFVEYNSTPTDSIWCHNVSRCLMKLYSVLIFVCLKNCVWIWI